jgi:hypothetical protein
MKAEFIISERAYVQALLLHSRPRQTGFVFLALCVSALMVGAVWSPAAAGRTAAMGGMIGLVVAAVGMRYVVLPLWARYDYKRYKAIQQEVSVELLDDGVQYTSADGSVAGAVVTAITLEARQAPSADVCHASAFLHHSSSLHAGTRPYCPAGKTVRPVKVKWLTVGPGSAEAL